MACATAAGRGMAEMVAERRRKVWDADAAAVRSPMSVVGLQCATMLTSVLLHSSIHSKHKVITPSDNILSQ